ncbi:hypothetical protein Tco_0323356 [Tanacetum coccineum]
MPDAGSKEENGIPPAVVPTGTSEEKQVAADSLGDVGSKVEQEIGKEFAAMMASGTVRATEAAALAPACQPHAWVNLVPWEDVPLACTTYIYCFFITVVIVSRLRVPKHALQKMTLVKAERLRTEFQWSRSMACQMFMWLCINKPRESRRGTNCQVNQADGGIEYPKEAKRYVR